MTESAGNSRGPGNSGKWIAAGASILVAIITVFGTSVHSKKQMADSTFVFSGVVIRSDGNPVTGATVLSTADQSIPQSTYSDSHGVFHVELPSSIHSLHITVQSDGFQTSDIDANPHRTGPELIRLNPEMDLKYRSATTKEPSTLRSDAGEINRGTPTVNPTRPTKQTKTPIVADAQTISAPKQEISAGAVTPKARRNGGVWHDRNGKAVVDDDGRRLSDDAVAALIKVSAPIATIDASNFSSSETKRDVWVNIHVSAAGLVEAAACNLRSDVD